MRFNLKRPCANCPFRKDAQGYLDPERAREIAMTKGTFACHKTITHDEETGDGITGPDSSHCAGYLIMREKLNKPSRMMRIAERLGMYDHTALDMSAPVFDSVREMVEAQGCLTDTPKRGKLVDEGQSNQGAAMSTLFDEIREGMENYMADHNLSAAKMGQLVGCSQQKIDSMRSKYVGHTPGAGAGERNPSRDSMREPALSKLISILRDGGYIEKRLLIPASERMTPEQLAEQKRARKTELQRARRAAKRTTNAG